MVSGRKDVSGESLVDLGEIASGMKVSTKLSLFNSGPRAAFVAAMVYPGQLCVLYVYVCICLCFVLLN